MMVLSDSVSVATSKLSTIQKLKEISEFLGEYKSCGIAYDTYNTVSTDFIYFTVY